MESTQKFTDLSSIGEFGIIDRISSGIIQKNTSTIYGIGDDAAVIVRDESTYGLISTDLLAEGIHFDLSYTPLKHLGFKSVAANVSDIAAMNGKAEQIVVSLALSSRFTVEAIDELYSGINLACSVYNIDLVGGDITSSKSGLIINVAIYGTVEKDKLTMRSGSKEHELIVVSGDLGAAYLGLQVLEREKAVFNENSSIQPDLSGYDYILERQLKPEARTGIIKHLSQNGIVPTSMIDVSDGLASELLHLSKCSGNGMQIYDDKVPLDTAVIQAAEEFGMNPLTCALNGGEDYELLFTVQQSDLEKIHSIGGLTIIGHVLSKGAGVQMVTKTGECIELKAQGWKHF
jgi:thiamine-monophosphate kinase